MYQRWQPLAYQEIGGKQVAKWWCQFLLALQCLKIQLCFNTMKLWTFLLIHHQKQCYILLWRVWAFALALRRSHVACSLAGWPTLFPQPARFRTCKIATSFLHFDLARHDGFDGKSFFNNRKTGSTAAPQSSDEMKSEGWMVFGDHIWFKISCATWFFLILMFFDLYLKAAYGRMSYGIHVWSICYTIARYECKR